MLLQCVIISLKVLSTTLFSLAYAMWHLRYKWFKIYYDHTSVLLLFCQNLKCMFSLKKSFWSFTEEWVFSMTVSRLSIFWLDQKAWLFLTRQRKSSLMNRTENHSYKLCTLHLIVNCFSGKAFEKCAVQVLA